MLRLVETVAGVVDGELSSVPSGRSVGSFTMRWPSRTRARIVDIMVRVERGPGVGLARVVWDPSPDDLWAVGSAGAIAHYDGKSWRQVAHQQIGAPYLRLFLAVHGTSSTDVWAVGQQLGDGGSTGLIYHYQP